MTAHHFTRPLHPPPPVRRPPLEVSTDVLTDADMRRAANARQAVRLDDGREVSLVCWGSERTSLDSGRARVETGSGKRFSVLKVRIIATIHEREMP